MMRCGFLLMMLATALAGCSLMNSSATAIKQRGAVPGETITVNGKQNIYAIAQEHGVSMRDIIILNNLHEPFAVKPGQSLVLPFKRGETAAPENSPAISGMMEAAPEPVIQSETLPPPVLAQPSPPQGLITQTLTTQTLTTQNPGAQSLNSQVLNAQNLNKPKIPVAGQIESLNAPAQAQTLKSVATTASPLPASASAVAGDNAAAAAAPGMIWPVQGPLLSGFGPKGQGVNNDGVNIGAPKGSPVVAAASGVVVYAGNEMKGFGNLVLIRHEGGWVTAYAYLDRVLVAKDAVVAQGDMIGTVGKTGNVSSPQLHFETRHAGKPVDPNGVVKS